MGKFIYVFTKKAFEALMSAGYTLLKSDKKNCIFVFENRNDLNFDLLGSDYVISNTLTF